MAQWKVVFFLADLQLTTSNRRHFKPVVRTFENELLSCVCVSMLLLSVKLLKPAEWFKVAVVSCLSSVACNK